MRPPRLAELAARGDRLVRIAALCAAAWAAFACVYVMFGRLGHPYELEWMTGAILDHIERIGHGEPIYAAPTASWIPFLYPPLYYWVSAEVAKVLPLTIACRSVSIVSAFVQAACVWRLARRRRATRFWSSLGVGAFFAAFAVVDYWYDLERPDALFVALVMIGCLALEESRGVVGATLAGLVVGSAFFVKQPAAVFLLGGSFALVVRREWARTAAFAIAGGAVIVVFVSRLQAETSGWFGYYVLAMPRAHGVSWSLVPGFVFGDLPHAWAWTVATAALAIAFFARRGRQTDDAVFACFVVSSFVASASSRLHIGGWSNVLSFWTAFGAAAIAVVGTRAEGFVRAKGQSLATAGAALLPGLFVVQILATAYVPADRVPTRASVPRFAALVDRIRALEQRLRARSPDDGPPFPHRRADRRHHRRAPPARRRRPRLPRAAVRCHRHRRFRRSLDTASPRDQGGALQGRDGGLLRRRAGGRPSSRADRGMARAPDVDITPPRATARRDRSDSPRASFACRTSNRANERRGRAPRDHVSTALRDDGDDREGALRPYVRICRRPRPDARRRVIAGRDPCLTPSSSFTARDATPRVRAPPPRTRRGRHTPAAHTQNPPPRASR